MSSAKDGRGGAGTLERNYLQGGRETDAIVECSREADANGDQAGAAQTRGLGARTMRAGMAAGTPLGVAWYRLEPRCTRASAFAHVRVPPVRAPQTALQFSPSSERCHGGELRHARSSECAAEGRRGAAGRGRGCAEVRGKRAVVQAPRRHVAQAQHCCCTSMHSSMHARTPANPARTRPPPGLRARTWWPPWARPRADGPCGC